MAFSLAIMTDGTAFDYLPRVELARIPRAAADAVEPGSDVEESCKSSTGETVGMWRVVGIGWPTMDKAHPSSDSLMTESST